MQVIVLSEFGPPGVLVPATADDPVPGPGQVVIAVEFANVTFVETQLRAGRAPFPCRPARCRWSRATGRAAPSSRSVRAWTRPGWAAGWSAARAGPEATRNVSRLPRPV